MENKGLKIKQYIEAADETLLLELLNSGVDPNYEGGWPVRLAARLGFYNIVKRLIQFGANPHLIGEAGASTLQLAVFSGLHWETDKWAFLLSCCDSSQLADGAAVAIVFRNVPALRRILATGRCNTNLPTTLTGRTVENLAKCYKLDHLLNISPNLNINQNTPQHSPRSVGSRDLECAAGYSIRGHSPIENLSPSVARFFMQSASQTGLSPPHIITRASVNSPFSTALH